MNLLLDTHAFLWFLNDDPLLSAVAKALIEDPVNRKLVSIASCWEIAIKVGLRKLDLGEPATTFLPREITTNNFNILAIELQHATYVETLPLHHRDPFDRLIISQALIEAMPIVSADPAWRATPMVRNVHSFQWYRRQPFQTLICRIDRDADRFECRDAEQRFAVVGAKDDPAGRDVAHEFDHCEAEVVFDRGAIRQFVGHAPNASDTGALQVRCRRHAIRSAGIDEEIRLILLPAALQRAQRYGDVDQSHEATL